MGHHRAIASASMAKRWSASCENCTGAAVPVVPGHPRCERVLLAGCLRPLSDDRAARRPRIPGPVAVPVLALERDELSMNRLLIPFVPAEAGRWIHIRSATLRR